MFFLLSKVDDLFARNTALLDFRFTIYDTLMKYFPHFVCDQLGLYLLSLKPHHEENP